MKNNKNIGTELTHLEAKKHKKDKAYGRRRTNIFYILREIKKRNTSHMVIRKLAKLPSEKLPNEIQRIFV